MILILMCLHFFQIDKSLATTLLAAIEAELCIMAFEMVLQVLLQLEAFTANFAFEITDVQLQIILYILINN